MNYDKSFNISYSIIAQNTFLVVQPIGTEKIMDYYLGMIENNDIRGLLKMHKQIVDDQIKLFFDITGKVKLIDHVKRSPLSQKQGGRVLSNLIDSIDLLPKYFLNADLCMLDENYIFIDEGLETYIALLPFQSMKSDNPNRLLGGFFRDFVGKCLMSDSKNDYYDGILKYLIKHDFDLVRFKELVKPKAEEAPVKDVKPIAPKQPESHIQPESNRSLNQAKAEHLVKERVESKAPDVNIPGAGIVIPGAGIPDAKLAKKKKKKKTKSEEKKGMKLFGFPLGGNKSNKKQEINMAKEEHIISGEKPASIPAQKGERWQGTVNLNDDGTVILDEGGNENEAYIIHNNNSVFIKETPFVIGKTNGNYIIQKKFISRTHATITKVNNEYFIQDENSKNHTYLNGIMIPPYTIYKLEDGAVITLADEEMIFKCK